MQLRLIRECLHKKQISPRMNTDDTDSQIQSGPILNFFDPCKSVVSVVSVLSVVRFVQSRSRRLTSLPPAD
jgi:hypothetical protein